MAKAKLSTAAAARARALTKSIKEHNARFAAASPAERRVMVAKDVIAQIKAKRFFATEGTYVDAVDAIPDGTRMDAPLRNILKKVPECHVCAKGAAFLSLVRLANTVKVGDVLDYYGEKVENGPENLDKVAWNFLEQFFPIDLLDEMERAFEDMYHGYEIDDADERLTAIMQNVIDNDGKAFTTGKTAAVWEAEGRE